MKNMNAFLLHPMKDCARHVIYTRYGITEVNTDAHRCKVETMEEIMQCRSTKELSGVFRSLEIAEPEFIERLMKMLSGSDE